MLLDVRDPDAVHAASVRVSEVVVIGGCVSGRVKRHTRILVPVLGLTELVGHIGLPPNELLEAVVRAFDIFLRFSSLRIKREELITQGHIAPLPKCRNLHPLLL